LQKINRAARRWKQPPKKPFPHVSREKILHVFLAALARVSPTAILNEEKTLGTRLLFFLVPSQRMCTDETTITTMPCRNGWFCGGSLTGPEVPEVFFLFVFPTKEIGVK